MAEVTIKKLLEAGVHFGHQTQRWNPKMKKYIFGERNGIYIIDLQITLKHLQNALKFLKDTAAEGQEVLWVGTKKQAQEAVQQAAEACEMPYVTHRWLGGMLTNFETVRQSIKKLDDIDKMEEEGGFEFVTKKEANKLRKEREKLQKVLTGIRDMRKPPAAIFILDSIKEVIAMKEALKLDIPIVSILDTNSDPDNVDYPIPGNDDAIRALRLYCEAARDAINEGRGEYERTKPAEPEVKEGIANEAAPAEEKTAEEAAEAVAETVEAAASPEATDSKA